jgi:hypothetical protein
MPKAKYDHTFEEQLRARDHGVTCMWQVAGIKNTMIIGMECLCVFMDGHSPRIFIVQTFEGGGWSAYTSVNQDSIETTIDAAEAAIRKG